MNQVYLIWFNLEEKRERDKEEEEKRGRDKEEEEKRGSDKRSRRKGSVYLFFVERGRTEATIKIINC